MIERISELFRRRKPDVFAVLGLVLLWGLYFWRVFTPSADDALSLREGDFSGQFVSFFGYQVERLSDGEIPLWNPYNNAGHPFLADTQSAVFYPPRLLSVSLVDITDRTAPGELYAALQTEMALHVLLGSLLMYVLVRRLTWPEDGARERGPDRASVIGALVAAVTYAYGGYVSGYPPLQLAVLEAGVWLPLVLLGIFQATQTERRGWRCMVLAGVALGIALLAGHPQTALFTIYFALAFLAYRLWLLFRRERWRTFAARFVLMAALFGLVAGGLAAVQLIPGLEYTFLSTREDLNFDDKGNGFPYGDVLQILFPDIVSEWSPLYFGVAGLLLALVAVWKRTPHSLFFGGAALLGLGLGFGKGTVLYDLAYLLVPGASWFRGQERAAFVYAHSASVLAGLGAAHLLAWDFHKDRSRHQLRRLALGIAGVCVLYAGVEFVLWRTPDGATYANELQSGARAALLAALAAATIPWPVRLSAAPGQPSRRALALLTLVVFDLFSVTQGGPNYENIPASDRLAEPEMVQHLRTEMLEPGARVDGLRGVRENHGTLYGIPDINGTSPLRLKGIDGIMNLPDDRRWDLLAVHYVLRDWEQLMAPSNITAVDEDPLGSYNVHLVERARPFAHLTYAVQVVGDDAGAYTIAGEPTYAVERLQQVALLDRDPGIDLPDEPPAAPGLAQVITFEPERIEIEADTPAPAVLTIALPDYPGWQATINGDDADILRAYGGLSAVALLDSGMYTVKLVYRPWTFRLGALLSLFTLIALVVLVVSAPVAKRITSSRRDHVTVTNEKV
ncbi:MAG: YfhO family protein [Chloroflexi bacterium]|nr:YfhO family protein [Chloroflexota bacterium]